MERHSLRHSSIEIEGWCSDSRLSSTASCASQQSWKLGCVVAIDPAELGVALEIDRWSLAFCLVGFPGYVPGSGLDSSWVVLLESCDNRR